MWQKLAHADPYGYLPKLEIALPKMVVFLLVPLETTPKPVPSKKDTPGSSGSNIQKDIKKGPCGCAKLTDPFTLLRVSEGRPQVKALERPTMRPGGRSKPGPRCVRLKGGRVLKGLHLFSSGRVLEQSLTGECNGEPLVATGEGLTSTAREKKFFWG